VSEKTTLELRWRHEWDLEREQRVQDSIELARIVYLLKRVAGWVVDDPLAGKEIRAAAVEMLELHGHRPTDLTQKTLI